MELKWTDKNEAHIARHGVSPAEVEQALSGRPLVFLHGREYTIIAQGTTYAGRYLTIVLTESIDGRFYVVTARDMTLRELQTFRKKKQ